MLDVYKQATPFGYHKVYVRHFDEHLIGGIRKCEMIDIKIVKDGDVYYYINKPIDGKK
jgi:hypothetical protein